MPAACPHLAAAAQRVVQALALARPGRRFTAREMLPRHPPARDFLRARRIAQVVDHQDVADITRHFGGDVGVALVHVEAVDADAAGLLVADQLGLRRVRDVVDLEPAVVVAALLVVLERAQVVFRHAHPGGNLGPRRFAPELAGQRAAHGRQLLGAAPDLAHVAFVIDDQDLADAARLVAVRSRIVERDGRDHARIDRIGDVDDRRAELLRIRDVTDVSVTAGHADLPGTGQVEMAEAEDIAGERGGTALHRSQFLPGGRSKGPAIASGRCRRLWQAGRRAAPPWRCAHRRPPASW